MTPAEINRLKSAVAQHAANARSLAERNVFRVQTDFMGRMADRFASLDAVYDDETESFVSSGDRERATEVLTDLAGLCIGLVAMLATDEPTAL